MHKPSRMVIVPSVPHFLAAAEADRAAGRVEIVAAATPHGVRPATMMARIAAGERPELRVFSDQLVDPEDAPIPVVQHGQLCFFPALEALLVSRHHYTASLWTANGFIELGGASFESVLRSLARYMDDCRQLDDTWQARTLQCSRSAEVRTDVVNAEVRRFRSAALYAYTRQRLGMDESLSRILQQVDSALQQNRIEA